MTNAALKSSQAQAKAGKKITRRIDLWDDGFPFKDPDFIETTISKTIWGVLDHCLHAPDIGLVIGSSGSGKTRAIQEYKRRQYFPHIVTCSIATRSQGSLLHQLGMILSCLGNSNYETVERIISRLSEFENLLIFDDCNFLRWEQFELIRHFYDRAKCGITFVGQETLYDRMIGNRRTYQWDQLISRIGIHLRLEPPTDEDIETICQKIYPDLSEKCLGYLFDRARGPGRLRAATKLLAKAIQVHVKEGVPLDVALLKKIDQFTTLKGGELLP